MNIPDGLIIAAQITFGFIMLFLGGNWLVDGSVALAHRLRISPLVIGLTIVAFGTSAPELIVSLTSAIKGNSGIAMGNVLGSNIANIGLILGLTALIYPIATHGRKVAANGLIMVAMSGVLLLFSLRDGLTRIEGVMLAALLVIFTVISVAKGRTGGSGDAATGSAKVKSLSLAAALLYIIVACVLLPLGADFLVDGATSLASSMGVSDKVIGLTIVAFGTSLPELAASVAAALKKEMDISIGNIIGSNIFNILCVLGISASIKPISFGFGQYMRDFVVMILFSVALVLLTQPWKQSGRLGRLSGFLLFAAYVVYVRFLF
ncbi:MAG: calcium/sodium antiporter [Bacteroidaceae bacterium]|nr:calcium/sodium antiporter [Bacteroidaceae bacterium]MBP5647328.1 calcium/sodium antiporter [Bacteroidaceae bacterium]